MRIQGFGDISNFAFERHGSPDFVIAGNAKSFVSPAHSLIHILTKKYGARVWGWRAEHKEPPTFLKAIHDEVFCPMSRVEASQVRIGIVKALIIFSNAP